MALNDQVLGLIASFADLDTRININRIIGDSRYRFSKKFYVSSESMAEGRFVKEMLYLIERHNEIDEVNDESVKVLLRMIKSSLSDAGLKYMKKNGSWAVKIKLKAIEILYEIKSYQWFHSPSKPERMILKAYARKAFNITGDIIRIHLVNGTIQM